MVEPAAIEVYTHEIDGENCIVSLSDSWVAFAARNGAPCLNRDALLGRSLFEFISGRDVQVLYRAFLEKLRKNWNTRQFPYRCDNPDCMRYLIMKATALPSGGVQFQNLLLREVPRPRVSLLDPSVARSEEVVAMCSICRRMRGDKERWFEIEEALKAQHWFEDRPMPRITHTYCGDCHSLLLERLELNR